MTATCYGWPAAELLGQQRTQLQLLQPQLLQFMQGPQRTHLQLLQPHAGVVQQRIRNSLKGSGPRLAQETGSALGIASKWSQGIMFAGQYGTIEEKIGMARVQSSIKNDGMAFAGQ